MTSIFDSLVIVDPCSEEWLIMWQRLADHRINKNVPDPGVAYNFDETWEYMSTDDIPRTLLCHKVVHVFRHRHHPCPCHTFWELLNPKRFLHGSLYLEIPVSDSYRSEYFKIKQGKAA
mgnify:CR=1 FL=1